MTCVSSNLIKVLGFESSLEHSVMLKLLGELAVHVNSTIIERLVSAVACGKTQKHDLD